MGYSGDGFNCTGTAVFVVLTAGGIAKLYSQVINCASQI